MLNIPERNPPALPRSIYDPVQSRGSQKPIHYLCIYNASRLCTI